MVKKGLFIISLLLVFSSYSQGIALSIPPEVIDKVTKVYGARAILRVSDWQASMVEKNNEDVLGKLRRVNDYFNRVPYATDPDHWGLPDYWAHPIELLVTNGGDCEDYVIAKFFTLIALGVPNDELRLTYVNALEFNQAHMVLTWYGGNARDPLVLDNLNLRIEPASARSDLQPVYTFNADHLWMSRERGKGIMDPEGGNVYWSNLLVGDADNLNLWAELLNRHELNLKSKRH